jgi:hypothetical protein
MLWANPAVLAKAGVKACPHGRGMTEPEVFGWRAVSLFYAVHGCSRLNSNGCRESHGGNSVISE